MEKYKTNKVFKNYADKYCKEYGKTTEEALQDSIVRAVEEQCIKDASMVADYIGQFMGKFTEVR